MISLTTAGEVGYYKIEQFDNETGFYSDDYVPVTISLEKEKFNVVGN